MLFLPESHGRFPVGTTTFKLPVSTKVLGTAKIHSDGHSDDGPSVKPALQLDEVVFTAYYPADVKGSNIKKGLDWLLRPLQASLHGYAHYSGISTWLLWPIVYLYGRLLKIPVYPNAPLLRQRPTASPERTQARSETRPSTCWPLVIFSHGLGGSRTAYSQVCSRLASSGRVVLAIQHRDGSGHAFVSLTTGPRLYVREKDLIWTSDDEKTMINFRQQQLAFRRHEIYLAFRSFKQLIQDGYQGSSHGLQSIDKKSIDWSSWSSDVDTKAVECDKDVLLAGHSFGGATVFTILSTDPPPDVSAPIPVHKALILDPWLEPIPSPGPSPPQGPGDTLPQLLVINSEKFSLWKDHFARLIGVVQAWEPEKRRVLTILRSQHESFSDFPLLPLVSRRAARIVMDKIMELSEAFIDGSVDTFVDETATRKMEIRIVGKKPDGSPQRQFVGEVGELIAH